LASAGKFVAMGTTVPVFTLVRTSLLPVLKTVMAR
jgi:hypothetical protein